MTSCIAREMNDRGTVIMLIWDSEEPYTVRVIPEDQYNAYEENFEFYEDATDFFEWALENA